MLIKSSILQLHQVNISNVSLGRSFVGSFVAAKLALKVGRGPSARPRDLGDAALGHGELGICKMCSCLEPWRPFSLITFRHEKLIVTLSHVTCEAELVLQPPRAKLAIHDLLVAAVDHSLVPVQVAPEVGRVVAELAEERREST